MERLHAEPQPESKVEAPQAPRQGQEKPVTALMAFLQAKHVRKKQGPAVVARPRKESRARPVCCCCASCLPCTGECVEYRAVSPKLQRHAPAGHSQDMQHNSVLTCLALAEGEGRCSLHSHLRWHCHCQEVSGPGAGMLACLSIRAFKPC